MTYYNAASGAGVFDVGMQAWVPLLNGPNALSSAITITTNLLLKTLRARSRGPHASATKQLATSARPRRRSTFRRST